MAASKTATEQSADGGPTAHTARLLELSANQIVAAIEEALVEVEGLSKAHLSIIEHVSDLTPHSRPTVPHKAPDSEKPVCVRASKIGEATRKIFAHLQFADRLHQRLRNIEKNLVRLAGLLASGDATLDNDAWKVFLVQTRESFTMEHERQLFDAHFADTGLSDDSDSAAASDTLVHFEHEPFGE